MHKTKKKGNPQTNIDHDALSSPRKKYLKKHHVLPSQGTLLSQMVSGKDKQVALSKWYSEDSCVRKLHASPSGLLT